MNRCLSDAMRVIPSCGCIFCDLNLKPVKMKRQWIHHDQRTGRITICEAMALKPLS